MDLLGKLWDTTSHTGLATCLLLLLLLADILLISITDITEMSPFVLFWNKMEGVSEEIQARDIRSSRDQL